MDNVALIDQLDANLLVGTIKWTIRTQKDRRIAYYRVEVFVYLSLKIKDPPSISSVFERSWVFSVEKGLKLDLWNRDPASVRVSSVAIGDRDGVVTSEGQVRDIQGEYRGTMEFGLYGSGGE